MAGGVAASAAAGKTHLGSVVVTQAGGIDVAERVDLGSTQEGDGTQAAVPQQRKGIEESGVHTGAHHHPGVGHGQGQLLQGWIDAAGLKEDNRLRSVDALGHGRRQHGKAGAGEKHVAIVDQTAGRKGHHLFARIGMRHGSLPHCLSAVQAGRIADAGVGLDAHQVVDADLGQVGFLVGHFVDPLFQVPAEVVVITRHLPVHVQVPRIVVIVVVTGRWVGPKGRLHHCIHQKGRQRVPVRIPAQEGAGHHLLTGDDDPAGGFGLLEVQKREPLDAHGSVLARELGVDERHIGSERRQEHHRLAVGAERVVRDDRLVGGNLAAAAHLGAEAVLVQHVALKPGTTGNKRQVQGAGQEPEAHVEVGVVLHLHVPGLHRLAKPDTGGRETTGAAVGQLQAAHRARPDQDVHGLTVRVHHEVQLPAALADDFTRNRHGVAVGRKTPQGDHVSVLDKAPHSLLGAHPLVFQINAGTHRLGLIPIVASACIREG